MQHAVSLQVVALSFGVLAAPTVLHAQVYDHLQCHKIRDGQVFSVGELELSALQVAFQVPSHCFVRGRATKFCVPVAKTVIETDAPVPAVLPQTQDLSGNDYACYRIKCRPPELPIAETMITDQFGARLLSRFKAAQEICVPAVKSPRRRILIYSAGSGRRAGELGNRAATTAICAAAAASQGLTCNSTLALLSYSGGDDIASMPANHGVPSDAPVIGAGWNAEIATNWPDFLDGSWETCFGGAPCGPPGPLPAGVTNVGLFTGSHHDGTLYVNCNDWSSLSDIGGATYAMVLCYGQVGSPYCDAGETLGRQGTTCDSGSVNVDLGCLCY